MIHGRRTVRRRGAALVEAAIVLTVFLTLIFGMLDLSIAVFRRHVVSEAARMGARQAAVHGSLAPSGWNGGPWNTTMAGVQASSTNPQYTNELAAITPYLVGLDLSTVYVSMSWPNSGSNAPESSVSVTVSTSWTPIMGFIFGNSSRTMQATSVMPIAH